MNSSCCSTAKLKTLCQITFTGTLLDKLSVSPDFFGLCKLFQACTQLYSILVISSSPAAVALDTSLPSEIKKFGRVCVVLPASVVF